MTGTTHRKAANPFGSDRNTTFGRLVKMCFIARAARRVPAAKVESDSLPWSNRVAARRRVTRISNSGWDPKRRDKISARISPPPNGGGTRSKRRKGPQGCVIGVFIVLCWAGSTSGSRSAPSSLSQLQPASSLQATEREHRIGMRSPYHEQLPSAMSTCDPEIESL